MSRTDRLFQIIQLLRDGRLHRGGDIAKRFGVSLRTIYRDMDTLIASGLPVEGERGLGYMMTAPITLPPLNLTFEELANLAEPESADEAYERLTPDTVAKYLMTSGSTSHPKGVITTQGMMCANQAQIADVSFRTVFDFLDGRHSADYQQSLV